MIPARALAAVPGVGQRSTPPRLTPLSGGLTNRSWRVDTDAGCFVLRLNLPSPDASALGIDREREQRLQRVAAVAGLAPQVVVCDPELEYLVSEYVEGVPWTPSAVLQTDRLRILLQTLRHVHALAPPAGTAPAAGNFLLQAVTRQIDALRGASCAEAEQLAALDAVAQEAAQRSESTRREATIVHSDVHAGNVMGRPGLALAPVLLDWEYAHIGDPLQDLASLITSHRGLSRLAATEHEALIHDLGLAQVATPAMLCALVRLNQALGYLWYRRRRLLRQDRVNAASRAVERELLDSALRQGT